MRYAFVPHLAQTDLVWAQNLCKTRGYVFGRYAFGGVLLCSFFRALLSLSLSLTARSATGRADSMASRVSRSVCEAINELEILALPPERRYYVPQRIHNTYFELSEHQTNLEATMRSEWARSMTAGTLLLDNNQGRLVLHWLTRKKREIKQALDREHALSFDVLVLGLVRVFMCLPSESLDPPPDPVTTLKMPLC